MIMMKGSKWQLQRTLALGLFRFKVKAQVNHMDRGRLKALFEQDDDDSLTFQARTPPPSHRGRRRSRACTLTPFAYL